jgi:hypothetical protein
MTEEEEEVEGLRVTDAIIDLLKTSTLPIDVQFDVMMIGTIQVAKTLGLKLGDTLCEIIKNWDGEEDD